MINEVSQNKCLLLLHSGLIVNIDGEDKKNIYLSLSKSQEHYYRSAVTNDNSQEKVECHITFSYGPR